MYFFWGTKLDNSIHCHCHTLLQLLEVGTLGNLEFGRRIDSTIHNVFELQKLYSQFPNLTLLSRYQSHHIMIDIITGHEAKDTLLIKQGPMTVCSFLALFACFAVCGIRSCRGIIPTGLGGSTVEADLGSYILFSLFSQ